MEGTAESLAIRFSNSKRMAEVSLADLEQRAIEFLELYAEVPVVPPEFRAVVGEGDGRTRLARMLEAAGRAGDSRSFFEDVLEQLGRADGTVEADVRVSELAIPHALLLELLELVIPGQELVDIRTVTRLEKLTNRRVPEEDREALQKVLDLYPVRLSGHTIRQMRLSPSVAWQYLPSEEELEPEGLVHTWVGQFHRGVIEQMYRNRVIFILNMSCPVYCRFCFRKHKECRTQRPPTQKHVDLGVAYIRSNPEIREIVLTGGDPFMNRPTLTRAVDGLAGVPHVETLRLATRSLAYHPGLFTAREGFWINYLKRKQLELEHKGKRLEIATHFIHPDELSVASLELIAELVGSGVPVYVQTPFLGGCNDSGEVMAELCRRLHAVGAELHYIFMPCSPIQGNQRYRTPISAGLEVARYLNAHLSDRATPHLCTATSIGKIDWGMSGWAVEKDPEDERYLWLRTPFNYEYFEAFAPILNLSRIARVNSEGTLDARYMADIGDARWLLGNREMRGLGRGYIVHERFPEAEAREALREIQGRARVDGMAKQSVVETGSDILLRPHAARVELDCGAEDSQLADSVRYVAQDPRISDVVLFAEGELVESLYRVEQIVGEVARIPHVTVVRLRTPSMNHRPEAFSERVVRRLGGWNRLTAARPLRIELETLFLHPTELRDEHRRVVRSLRRKGITVYSDTPLLVFLNDGDDVIYSLVTLCRKAGVEMHRLYLAGHPLQREWSRRHPLHHSRVFDLASHLRRECSGRELPRFVVRTELGDIDWGIGTETVESDGQSGVRMRLAAFDLAYYRSLDPGFELPEGVELDDEGHPIVTVEGMLA